MANKHRSIDTDRLRELAWQYIDECTEATKEVAMNTGVKEVRDREIPDVRYFLRIWLRQKQFDFYQKTRWYDVLNDPTHPLSDTIKNIDDDFKALGRHIVANEGKGIFYGKNFLGMHDRQQVETREVDKFDFDE